MRRLVPLAALVPVLALAACAPAADDGARAAGPSVTPAPTTPVPSPSPTPSPSPSPSDVTTPEVTAALAALEADHGARVGLLALDTGTGRTVAHRADERFAYASTHKALLVAVLLDRTTSGDLARVVPYGPEALVPYSPVTELHAGAGMALADLAAAAVVESDNTAANLVLEAVGGPAGFAAGLAALGDDVTRPARAEPDLNGAVPGDERDTTTPRALATDLAHLVVGDGLAPEDRDLLAGWLRASTTGTTLVRAAVPDGWDVGDKSGTAAYGTRNDVAVVRPPGRAPVVVAVMTTRAGAGPDAEPVDALVADVARVGLEGLGLGTRGVSTRP